jgi:hypothetical protein
VTTTNKIADDSTVAVHLVHAADSLSELIAIAYDPHDMASETMLGVARALQQLWLARWELGLLPGAGLLEVKTSRDGNPNETGTV